MVAGKRQLRNLSGIWLLAKLAPKRRVNSFVRRTAAPVWKTRCGGRLVFFLEGVGEAGLRGQVLRQRMLLQGAEALLLDEPFAALDAQLKLVMHDLLLRLASEGGQTVVLVTHDLMEAVTLADRVIVCTHRPATIALEQAIDLPRPRDVINVRFTSRFRELYDAIWERLRIEYHEERL